MMIRYLLPATMFVTLATPAWAQTTLDTTAPSTVARPREERKDDGAGKISGLIAIGGGFLPRYEGASRYRASPFALAAVRWRGVEFNLVGTELRIDLGGGGHFLFGPSLELSNGRKDNDTQGRLDLLDPIDDSLAYGGFIGYRFGGDARGQGRVVVSLQATRDTKTRKGMSFSTGLSYAAIRNKRIFTTFDLGARFNDGKFTRTFFGVTPQESEATGLRAYRPGGGLTRVSAGVTAGYQLSRHWGLLARAQGGTYTGDAADSPIVDDGSKGFAQVLFGVSYAF
jgi:MipA family protein